MPQTLLNLSLRSIIYSKVSYLDSMYSFTVLISRKVLPALHTWWLNGDVGIRRVTAEIACGCLSHPLLVRRSGFFHPNFRRSLDMTVSSSHDLVRVSYPQIGPIMMAQVVVADTERHYCMRIVCGEVEILQANIRLE